MPDDTKLILVKGPSDEDGLDHFFLYCRSCHMVSDLIGGTDISNPFEAVGVYDPAEVLELFPDHFYGIFAARIQNAMREDGVIK